jgi:DNA-directed RNA polymerase
MASSLGAVVDGIERARVVAEQGKGTRGCTGWGIPFLVMDPGVLALSTIAVMLDGCIADRFSLTHAIAAVGERAELEWHYMMLREEAPRLKAVMERRIKRWDRRAVTRARVAMSGERWTAKQRRQVGAKLLVITLAEAGLFKSTWTPRHGSSRRGQYRISLTPAAMEILHKMNEHLELMQPLNMPMVVPPTDWAKGEEGGYRLSKLPFVISKPGAPPPIDDHGPDVYHAVNTVQRTAWRINPTVLCTLKAVWDAGGGWAGVPGVEPMSMQHRYPEHGTDEEKRKWKSEAAGMHQRNARAVGKRLAFLNTLYISDRFKDKTFYFPHRCDFRGRIYPIPQFLQPQGNDVARGLLMFGEPKPLGKRGLYWLKIQYANGWGVDKVSFQHRVEWTDNFLSTILRYQKKGEYERSPLNYKGLWAEADDPWQALATLVEILNAHASGDPESYECALPVSVDGSNSGLQHFSAMLRDPLGGRLVNLTPAEQPHDIYADVASVVEREIKADRKVQEQPEDIVEGWLAAGIDRKLTKRGTMTFCYGVTQQGLKNALISDGFVDWAHNQFSAVTYIGKKIWGAIKECITSAEQAMEWLRQCAVCANKAGVLIEWLTPIGFHVTHPYLDAPYTRVRCLSAQIHFKVYDPDASVMPNRQRQAMPPNFVHSLDACHLMMTVVAGEALGIRDWMMIHDSFGTHACDVGLLNRVLREEFVNLYSIDVLDRFRLMVTAQTGYDPGPPPAKGDFNLEDVLESEYFFA